MEDRCSDENNSNYGGRGIAIKDDLWLDFETFYKDMGERPFGVVSLKVRSTGRSRDTGLKAKQTQITQILNMTNACLVLP